MTPYIQKCEICQQNTQYAIKSASIIDPHEEIETNLCPLHFGEKFIESLGEFLKSKLYVQSISELMNEKITDVGFTVGMESRAYSSNALHTITLKRVITTCHFRPNREIGLTPTFVFIVDKQDVGKYNAISIEAETYGELFYGIRYGFQNCLEHV